MSATTTSTILLTKLQREIAEIEIVGTAPLIVHRWSEKAKLMMLLAQQGKKVPKDPKDPKHDFESSMYRFADGSHGFPVTAFKSATVKGARAFKNVRMTELRQMLTFLVDGYCTDGMQLTRLSTTDPVMREDMVRVGMEQLTSSTERCTRSGARPCGSSTSQLRLILSPSLPW